MTTTFNVVNFIETNPITTISSDYNSRILSKIKDSFTENEQQLYITSFYGYLNYSKHDFVIDLDNIWSWLGFSMKQSAKRVIIKNLIENTDYKISLNNLVERSNDTKGGENKETILLTINAFKKLCLKSGTKKADVVHDYFIKLEEIMHEVVKEECEELKQKLEQIETKNIELETKNTELETEVQSLTYTNEKDRHSLLCQYNDKTRLVYVLKMKTLIDGSFVIKIGETNDIKQRCQAISCDFGIKVTIMDLFPCDLNYEFERFLHSQPILTRHKYKDPIANGKKSTETYLMSNMRAYNKIKQFIQRNGIRFHSKNAENIKYTAINNVITMFKDDKDKVMEMIEKITSQSTLPVTNDRVRDDGTSVRRRSVAGGNSFPDVTEQYTDIDKHTNTVIDDETNAILENAIQENTVPIQEAPVSKPNKYSPRVQIYHPNDLTKVFKVFDSITEATREIEGTSYTHIKYAYKHRTIYKNYRWYIIPSTDTEPLVAKNIGATVDSNQRRSGMVAKLNIEKTKVLQVFKLQKDAAKECDAHVSLLSNAMKYGSVLRGSYWVSWDDLDMVLQKEFLQSNKLPVIEKKARGNHVQLINPMTGMLEKEYPSIADATKEMKVSSNTIKRSSAEDLAIGGWKWKIL
jgi:NUMOD1 domain